MKQHIIIETNNKDNNPYVKNDYCRICQTPLREIRQWHDLRKFCSVECQRENKKIKSKAAADLRSKKLSELNKSIDLKQLKEPELCREDLRDVLVSLNLVEFDIKSGLNNNNSRIKIMQKIRQLGIKTEVLVVFREVEIFVNKMPKIVKRRYNTVHITPNNFYKLLENSRNMYLKHKSYTYLHSYQNMIKDTIAFNNYVNQIQIIEGK